VIDKPQKFILVTIKHVCKLFQQKVFSYWLSWMVRVMLNIF